MSQSVVIVGASGFIGKYLAQAFVDAGYRVTGLARASYTREESTAPNYRSVLLVEPFEASQLEQVFHGADLVVHAAGVAHQESAKNTVLEALDDGNVKLTESIMIAAREAGVRRLIYISSLSVEVASDRSAYAESKRRAESVLQSGLAGSTTDWICIRPPMVYGPMAPGNFKHVVRLATSPFPIPVGCLDNRRSTIAIWNLASFVVMLAGRPESLRCSIAVSDGSPLSVVEFVRQVGFAFNARPVIWNLPRAFIRLLASFAGRRAQVERLMQDCAIEREDVFSRFQWHPPFSRSEALRKVAEEAMKSS